MKQTREEKLLELLHESTTNRTAHSLVDARITNPRNTLTALLFGVIFAALTSAKDDESGFVMIDEGKLYFYPVTGLGKRQEISGRREISMEQMERVRHTQGKGRRASALSLRWRNSKNKKLELNIGSLPRQFPNQHQHIENIVELIAKNNIEVKLDKSGRNAIIILVVVFTILILLVGALFLLEEVFGVI